MLFAVCPRCGGSVEEEVVLLLVKHFSWRCPICGGENPPLGTGGREVVMEEGD